MITHNLIQGSPEWLAHRGNYDNASEIAAVLGLSKTTTRTEMLRMKATGLGKEFSEWVQVNVLDNGHRVEALVRPLVESTINEDLYPVTCSEGRLSASLDGLTASDEIAFECKQWNAEIAAEVASGIMPAQHMPQCQQILMITGAKKLIFAVGDGTPENLLTLDVLPDPKYFELIIAAWAQFNIDLAAYIPPEITTPVMAAPQLNLPAVSIQVTGSIALVDNLEKFGTALTAYIAGLNREPETDQDFANLEDAVKRLKVAEEALDAAEAGALGQTESIDTMRRTVALHRETARSTRLLIDKLVKAEKENRRTKIISDAVADLHVHITGLTKRVGNYPFGVQNKFTEVVKGLKSIDSMRDKVATELARCKIESSAAADRVEANLKTEGLKEYGFLFADMAQIASKAPDDFQNTVTARITGHKAAEAAKEEATRERIRAEEQAKAETAARDKMAQDQAFEAKRLAQIAAYEKLEADEIARLARLNEVAVEEVPRGYTAPADSPRVVIPLKTDASTLIRLGQINERLAPISITADGLAQLGYTPAAIDKTAKLYRESDLQGIYSAMTRHIQAAWRGFKEAA